MTKVPYQIFILLLSNVAALGYAEPHVRKAESSVTESVGPQGSVTTIVNTVFTPHSLYDERRSSFSRVILSTRVESTYISGREGADSNLEAVAWINESGKYDSKLWVIRDRVDTGAKWGDYYKTTKYGCCGAEDVSRAFDFKTGKYAFSYTAEPVFVDIPNTPIKRTISYISANAATDYEHEKRNPRGIGALTMSTGDSPIDELLIESDDRELAWSPKLTLANEKEPRGANRLSLWHSNGKNQTGSVSAFFIKLFFYDGMEIHIPVNGDRFDIQESVLPDGVSVRRVLPQ